MAQQVPGISKIIYKAVTGSTFTADVEIDGNDIANEGEILREVIGQTTAKGSTRHQGNRSYEFTLNLFAFSQKAAIEGHKNIFGDMEIYSIDDTVTPIMTLTNVNPMVGDRVNLDPSDEAGAYFPVSHSGVNPV